MSYKSKIIVAIATLNLTFSSVIFASAYSDLDIHLSKSVGIWELNNDYGYFKVIVYRIGLEHPVEKVRILVTKANSENNVPELFNEFELGYQGVKGYIQNVSLSIVDNRLAVGLDIEMKGMDGVILREVFLADINGNIRVLSPAKYSDIYDQEPVPEKR